MKKKNIVTPVGKLTLVADENGISQISFPSSKSLGKLPASNGHDETKAKKHLENASSRIQEYFAGDEQALSRITISPQGTSFQKKVWNAARRVKPGKTISYGALAEKIGCPGGARAVGSALNKNPVALAVPCHRVLGADDSLTGFAGGINTKRKLLRFEGAL